MSQCSVFNTPTSFVFHSAIIILEYKWQQIMFIWSNIVKTLFYRELTTNTLHMNVRSGQIDSFRFLMTTERIRTNLFVNVCLVSFSVVQLNEKGPRIFKKIRIEWVPIRSLIFLVISTANTYPRYEKKTPTFLYRNWIQWLNQITRKNEREKKKQINKRRRFFIKAETFLTNIFRY